MAYNLQPHDGRKGPLLRLRGMVRRLGPAAHLPETRPAEVRPPALGAEPRESVWASLLHWLRDEPADEPDRVRVIDAARADFQRAMADLCSAEANGLRLRVGAAGSLRELWHLRAELYSLIARQLSQAHAERRLTDVNRHFPVGARTGLAKDAGAHHG